MSGKLIGRSLQLIHAGSAVYGYFWMNENLQFVAKFLTVVSIAIALLMGVLLLIIGIALLSEDADREKLLDCFEEGHSSLIWHHLSSLAVVASFAWFGHLVWAFAATFEWAAVCFMRFVMNQMTKEESTPATPAKQN